MSDYPEGVALVVGGSGGIGSEIARELARGGASVALTFRTNEAAARAVASELDELGVRCSVHALSLDQDETVSRCLNHLAETYRAIHTIVHAAGTHIDQPYVSQVAPQEWRRVIDTDVNGFFHVASAGLKHLRSSRGSLVYVSTAGLDRFPPGDVLSVAPKGANEALVRAIAREEGRYGVRANIVRVGVVDGGMFPRLVERGELPQEWVDRARQNTPLGRFGDPKDVAAAVAFFASARASYVTGQTVAVDGGYTL